MDQSSDDQLKMFMYENRLLTFVGWPFEESCICTPVNMAKAGFIHTPSDNSPDIAQCFFCLKELEGWEPEDDPVSEHKKHSPKCDFILLKKPLESLTVEEFLKLQKEKQKFFIKKSCGKAIDEFEAAVVHKRAEIIKTAMGEE